jgi:hypothetical protein
MPLHWDKCLFLKNCSFVIYFEVQKRDASSLVIFAHGHFGCLGSFENPSRMLLDFARYCIAGYVTVGRTTAVALLILPVHELGKTFHSFVSLVISLINAL